MVVDLDKGGRIPQIHRSYLGPTKGWVMTDEPTDIEWVIDNGGQEITAGFSGTLLIPEWLIIHNWFMMSDLLGSIELDIWKMSQDTIRAGSFPSVANTIVGGNYPKIVAAKQGYSATLTGWTTQIDQNDVLAFNVRSATQAVRVTTVLQCVRVIGQFAGPQT